MSRRLTVLVLAVTSLVVIAFTVPLGFLVRQQADVRARAAAERDVQAVAAAVVREVVAVGGTVDPQQIEERLSPLPDGLTVIFPDESSVGPGSAEGSAVTRLSEVRRGSYAEYTVAGWEIALPVITEEGNIVVWSVVTSATLTRGVASAQALLAALGVGMIGISLLVAWRLGRSLTRPVSELADAAHALAAGDLDRRVSVSDPPELAAVAEAFNQLAPRLQDLIAAEREEVADVSHRLRTPLAAVRFHAEAVEDPDERTQLLSQVDRLQQAVDDVIAEARRRPSERAATVDLNDVVRRRLAFWSVLADEQNRIAKTEMVGVSLPVAVDVRELNAAVDALIDNVFTHTEPGTGFRVETSVQGSSARVAVSDAGDGFPAGFDPLERGRSGRGSTGLGLDIVKRLVERLGGRIRVGRSTLGGALVEFEIPLAAGGGTPTYG